MHQGFWGYKVEEKFQLEVREQERLNTVGLQGAAVGDVGGVEL
jgi:hypothetical protein